ncbi:hypothetical protein ACFYUV_38250 [Nonomuraea sp. NPDC003560]|uniref:hypothetical protein n=1 Tax=Nonomuraea sp. NPDC003560 TaxID=3364341 RepID=UPI00368FE36B
MNLYESTLSKLRRPRPGRVVLRDGQLMGVIDLDGGALECTREELLTLANTTRELAQRVIEAEKRQAAGQRPIPVHGQPARPYTAQLAAADVHHPGAHARPTPDTPPAPSAAAAAAPPPAPMRPAPVPAMVPAARQEAVVPDPPRAAAS